MFDFYIDRGVEAIRRNDHKALLSLLEQAVADFNGVDIYDREFTKIGLVGEIYVKYNSYGQDHRMASFPEYGSGHASAH